MDPSRTSVHSAGAGMHASAMKPAATAATEAAAAASTTGISVIRKQADGNENHSCQNGEDTTKHGVSSLTDEIANDEAATISAREIDVDQWNAIALKIATLRGARSNEALARSIKPAGTICTLLPDQPG
ncbi:hypothetical protein H8A92_29220 [Bradyrhizobium sp. 10BB]|nr:hypothetical protein [Bradyrhizobium acaciae]